ncbi:outer membrane beta-barrel family protein [Paraflavitalea pollutisoli]|uniref:outer membrane beta-barrel family protein n=1 Tax=Paraflavitalea pollutisoli TaxID=3034143 RepID=UPI0023EB93F6|nr:outer membrane beta-barrel family protein [Paraflavitalea sp. H1-2-19X]
MNRNTKLTIAYVMTLFFVSFATAQDIAGTITDSLSKQALPQATVSLVQQDQVLASITTDNKGQFRFKDRSTGVYALKIAYVGYKTILLAGIQPGSNQAVRLVLDQKDLQVVTVSAAKPYIVQKIDKTIVNIAGSPIAAGGTAWEVLLRAPGVVEEGSGLKLKGKRITVLIDGRYSNLSGEDLKNMLSAMAANGIERIELMSNPSAKYEAQGGAIINIVMAKNTKLGTNGTALISGRAGKYGSWNTGGTLNYRSKKLNVYGGYDYLDNQQSTESQFTRFVSADKQISDHSNSFDHRTSHNIKLGLDYDLSKRSTFGGLVKGTLNNIDRRSAIRSLSDIQSAPIDSFSIAAATGRIRYLMPSVNLYYKAILDSTGKELRFNADYLGYEKKWNDQIITRYSDPKGAEYTADYLRAAAPASNDIKSFSVDYTNPIKNGAIEAGLKASLATTDNDALWERAANGNWAKDPARTNHFVYTENIYAGYVSMNKRLKKWSVMAGVRAEQTYTEGNSITADQVNKNNYFNIFPNAALQYQASEAHVFGLSYRKSIERYKYDVVNPFIVYKSQYSYYQGNPNLNPGIQHNFELSYSYNYEWMASLVYTRYNDVVTEVFRKDPNSLAVVTTYDNLASADYYEAAVSHSKSFFNNKWISNVNLSLAYAKFNAGGPDFNNAQLAMMVNTDQTIVLPKSFKVQVSASYMSPMALGVVTTRSRINMELGASKSVLKGSGTVSLRVSDPFNLYDARFKVSSFGVEANNNVKPETRFVKATFTYRFGNKNVKANTNRKNAIESESRRMQ